MHIQLLYCADCPGWRPALTTLNAALAAVGPGVAVELVEVTSDARARALRFLGSPTIRVDGRDIEPGAAGRADFGLACRAYPQPGGGVGPAPPAALIAAALRRSASSATRR